VPSRSFERRCTGPTKIGGPPVHWRAVSSVEQPRESTIRFYPPDEALSLARSLPAREHLIIEDVPDDEWAAFLEALAES
jgi:hypothetical protein